jgi:hypothetical protein
VQVTLRDALGNVATGFTGTVTLALAPNVPGATLLGTTTVNAVAGVATFSSLRVERVATGLAIVATSTGLANATSTTFNVTPAAAATLRVLTQPAASAASGVVLTTQPRVIVEDAFGNAVTTAGRSVTATVATGPAGSSVSGATVTTAATGIATFTSLALTGASGSYTLSFASTGVPSVASSAITVGAGAATQLALVTAPSATARCGRQHRGAGGRDRHGESCEWRRHIGRDHGGGDRRERRRDLQ